MIIVSKTYATTTPESVEHGDYGDRGFEWENVEYTFRELVDELREYSYPNCSHYLPDWVTTEDIILDYRTLECVQYSLHVGKDARSRRYWGKALLCAGLIKPSQLL